METGEHPLHYASDRVEGRKNSVVITLSGGTVPASLKGINLEIYVAGRKFFETFPALPNQRYTFEWDGKDQYGRDLVGKQPIIIRIDYSYPIAYAIPSSIAASFGSVSGVGIGGTSRLLSSFILRQVHKFYLNNRLDQPLGGWSLSMHHAYAPLRYGPVSG